MTSANIDEFLASCKVPGIVALGTNASDTLYLGTAGTADAESGKALMPDTPHAIFSMTKPVTSFAIMQLIGAGKIALHDPASSYVDFAPDVLINIDLDKKTLERRPPQRAVTIHDLLTNTCGLGYSFSNPVIEAFLPESEQNDFGLLHEPGAAWTYGFATRILGNIIASVTGSTLEDALTKMIFDPLGMTRTSYDPQPEQALIHWQGESGWQPRDLYPRMELGDAGLISTAEDYARFLRCLLNDGAPLMRPDTFASMISNQIGDLFVTEQPACQPHMSYPFPTGGGVDKFGYGFQLHMQPDPGMRSPGSYSWCGVANTYFWGDPVKKVGGIVLMQTLPLYAPENLAALSGFEKRFYELID